MTNDTLSPLRSYTGGTVRRAVPRARSFRGRARPAMPTQAGGPNVAGRWSLVRRSDAADTTVRGVAIAEGLLERHGVVTRGAVVSEGIRGGFSLAYRVLSRFEESGRARRGYFIEGLGAAQFATGPTVDRLRMFTVDPDAAPPLKTVTLAASDPANPYGAALPWPKHDSTHRPGRKAGALVVLVDGALALYVEKGGKTMLLFDDEPAVAAAVANSLGATLKTRGGRMRVERVNGNFIVGTPLGDALAAAGFGVTPQGLSLRA